MIVASLSDKHEFKFLLEAANLSKSTYYNNINKEINEKEIEIKNEIIRIFDESDGTYGYRRVYGELINNGVKITMKALED